MIFEDLLIFTAVVGGMMSLLTIGGSNLYDLRHINLERQYKRTPNARRYRPRPLVTVIIPTSNDEHRIGQTLASLALTNYRKLEIIVVDTNSSDTTRKIVRQFIDGHPNKNIRLSAKRRAVESYIAVADVLRAHAKGKLIMWLKPGQRLDSQAISNAVRHFNTEPDLGGLSCRLDLGSTFTISGLFQRFEMMLSYRSQKFNSVTHTDYAAAVEGVIYQRVVLDKLLSNLSRTGTHKSQLEMISLENREARLCYGNDVIIYAVPVTSFWALIAQRYQLQLRRLEALKSYHKLFFSWDNQYHKFLTWFRLPFAILIGIAALFLPILLTYFVYLVVRLHQPALYALSWALLTFYTVFAVWGDVRLKLRQKAGYTFLAPITQAVFYLLSFVQLFVVVRGLLGRRKPTI